MYERNEPVAAQQPAPPVVELVPPAPAVPRDAGGKFLSQGCPPEHSKTTRALGFSLSRATRVMKSELAQRLLEGGPAINPLVLMLDISSNPSYHPSLRLSAADRLCRYLLPGLLKLGLDMEHSSEADEQKIAATRQVFRAMFQMTTERVTETTPHE